MNLEKTSQSIKLILYGAVVLMHAATSSHAQAAFQADCNAYLTMKGKLAFVGGDVWGYTRTGTPGPRAYSLLILPDIGNFVVGRGGAYHTPKNLSATPISETQSKDLLRQHFSRTGPETDDPNLAANWVMSEFECVAKDDYLKSTLDSVVGDITLKFEASETRVQDALLRSFSGQMVSLIGRIDAIRREIPSLSQTDRDELNNRLTILEAQVETAIKDICVAVKMDEAQC